MKSVSIGVHLRLKNVLDESQSNKSFMSEVSINQIWLDERNIAWIDKTSMMDMLNSVIPILWIEQLNWHWNCIHSRRFINTVCLSVRVFARFGDTGHIGPGV